jgi:cytochrome P450
MLFQLHLISISFALLAVYYLSQRLELYLSRRAFATNNGCKKPKSRVPLKDPFLALDFVWKTLQNAKNDRYLAGTYDRFKQYGTTFVAKHLTFPTIHTIDPENIKQILAIGFEDFKLSSFRVDAMIPLFGQGIFTSNGHRWSHSRAVLRPSFARHNMENHLPFMESHFEQLMKAIPKDGSVVDLQKLFFAFTMDTATEFLFGHSVHALYNLQLDGPATADDTDAEFVDAYT